jgi:hypothetical protein
MAESGRVPGEADEPTSAEEAIDEVLAESFPASDAPPWTLGLDPHSVYVAASEEPATTDPPRDEEQ